MGSYTLDQGSIYEGSEVYRLCSRCCAVWEACSALKKTPATNITAIGRTMAQVAVSMKDVLREMKELKPASSDPTDETSDEASMLE